MLEINVEVWWKYRLFRRIKDSSNTSVRSMFENFGLQTWPFHQPVSIKTVPDYHKIVKIPMDLQTMREVRIKAYCFLLIYNCLQFAKRFLENPINRTRLFGSLHFHWNLQNFLVTGQRPWFLRRSVPSAKSYFISSQDIVDTSFRLSRENLWPVPKRTQGTKLSVTVANAERNGKKNELCLEQEKIDTTDNSARCVKFSMIAGVKLQYFHWFVKPLSVTFWGNKINTTYLS